MANDIRLIIDGQPIKHGTCVVGCRVTGFNNHDLLDSHGNDSSLISNTPTINELQNKYDNRFDDPSYYYGIDQP